MNSQNHGLETDQERPCVWGRSLLATAGLAVSLLASPGTSTAQLGGGRWRPTSLVGAPEGRWEHVVVWTGSKMIVWGGYSATDFPVTVILDVNGYFE